MTCHLISCVSVTVFPCVFQENVIACLRLVMDTTEKCRRSLMKDQTQEDTTPFQVSNSTYESAKFEDVIDRIIDLLFGLKLMGVKIRQNHGLEFV